MVLKGQAYLERCLPTTEQCQLADMSLGGSVKVSEGRQSQPGERQHAFRTSQGGNINAGYQADELNLRVPVDSSKHRKHENEGKEEGLGPQAVFVDGGNSLAQGGRRKVAVASSWPAQSMAPGHRVSDAVLSQSHHQDIP